MSKTLLRGLILLTALVLGPVGCGDDSGAVPPGPGPGPGPAPGGMGAEPVGANPTIRQIMGKLTKGPGSLTAVIGKALEADAPPWDTIGPQAQEYARLAASMSENNPPRGTKESWTKLTSEFASASEALNKAAQAKDRDAALEAHGVLTGSCMGCHREHRRGPGMGGPPMGGPPMGGPPGGGQRGAFPKGAAPPPGD